MLLGALDELKSACVSAERLEQAAGLVDDSLGDKLHDLALISAAYDAVVANGHADPSDRLSLLAGRSRRAPRPGKTPSMWTALSTSPARSRRCFLPCCGAAWS